VIWRKCDCIKLPLWEMLYQCPVMVNFWGCIHVFNQLLYAYATWTHHHTLASLKHDPHAERTPTLWYKLKVELTEK